MGKVTKKLEQERIENESKIVSTLKKNTPKKVTYKDYNFVRELRKYSHNFIRNPEDWKCKLKTKDFKRRGRDLIQFTFCKYTVPRFLYESWNKKYFNNDNFTGFSDSLFLDWFFCVGKGESLHKKHTKDIFSKKETHIFLNAPNNNKIIENIWWAKVRGYGASINKANHFIHTKIGDYIYSNEEFHNSVILFFIQNNINVKEMNNLIDYIWYEYKENVEYTLKGRTLNSLRKKHEEWIRYLNKQKDLYGVIWTGLPIKNWKFTYNKKTNKHKTPYKITYYIRQITNGNNLLREGQIMRHCVASYKRDCMEGRTSIWSMTKECEIEGNSKCLTIEFRNNSIRQAIGYVGRPPDKIEEQVLQRWLRKIKN